MRSLRARLLFSLWVAIAGVAVFSIAISYRVVRHETKKLLDNELAQIARIAERSDKSPRDPRADDENILVSVWNHDGVLLYTSTPSLQMSPHAPPGLTELALDDVRYRVYATVSNKRRIQVAQPVDVRDDQAEAAALAALLPVLLLLPVLAAVIAWVIHAELKPVQSMAKWVAQRGPLDVRALPAQTLPTEVVPLVEEINRLLERQGGAVARELQFVADAAHALRTPLAALQLQADVLDGSADPVERDSRTAELRAGIARCVRLSNQLLSLARVEQLAAVPMRIERLDDTLERARALYEPAAKAKGVLLKLDADFAAGILVDEVSLMLIVGNLLDNALRYSPPEGSVQLVGGASEDCASIEIRDEGHGLHPEELERVFERFYRAPGEAGIGSGLGLSTVKSLVGRLGGRIELQNRTDRSGLIARIILPRHPRPTDGATCGVDVVHSAQDSAL